MLMASLQALIDGLMLGGIYSIISSGLSLVFGVLGIVNFAHAQFLMLGMYTAWVLWSAAGVDPLLGCLLSGLIVGCLGYFIQRFLIQRVLNAPPVAQIFLTVGLMIVLENAVLLYFGSEFKSVLTSYQAQGFRIGSLFVSAPYAYAFLAATIITCGLWLFLKKNWFGRAIRATAQDAMAATLSGVPVKQIYGIAFGVGVGFTAVGGTVILPYMTVSPTVGGQFSILMFTAVVLGGLGNVAGALVGGLIVGLIQSFSAMILPVQLQNLVLFVVFIAILSLRPQGLLKEN